MSKIKLVAESLQEYNSSQTEDLNESLSGKLKKLNRKSPEDVKKFGLLIAGKVVGSDAIRNTAKAIVNKLSSDQILKIADKAAGDGFKGRFVVGGDKFGYKLAKDVTLKSKTAGGGTQGKFAMGGV